MATPHLDCPWLHEQENPQPLQSQVAPINLLQQNKFQNSNYPMDKIEIDKMI